MKRFRPFQLIAFLLAALLGLPSPASALRPQLDQAGLEERLASNRPKPAGLEEGAALSTPVYRAASAALDRIQQEANKRLGLKSPWEPSVYYTLRLVTLAQSFLDHPKLESARPVVQELMVKIDEQVLKPLLEAGEGWAAVLPRADDWLVYGGSQLIDTAGFAHRMQALSLYSKRGSALAFGRNGSHLRAERVGEDDVDIETAHFLLQGFHPYLDGLLRQAAQLRAQGIEQPELEKEAAEYAGALYQGFMFPSQTHLMESYRTDFRLIASIARPPLDQGILNEAAELYPEKFPKGFAPRFLLFAEHAFSTQTVADLVNFNRDRPASERVSLWDLTVGSNIDNVNQFLTTRWNSQVADMEARPDLRPHLSDVYQFILEQGRQASPHGGLEEAFIEKEKLLNQDPDFLSAMDYFNDAVLPSGAMTWYDVAELFRIFRGEGRNDALRIQRIDALTEQNPRNLLRLVNSSAFERADKEEVARHAASIYVEASRAPQFLMHLSGFDEVMPRLNAHFRGSANDAPFPASGHHRLAWFMMSYFLIRNGYNPFYFEKEMGKTIDSTYVTLERLLEKGLTKHGVARVPNTGLEEGEPEVRRRVYGALDGLIRETEGVLEPAKVAEVLEARGYSDRIHRLMGAFLDHRTPRAVEPQVRGFLDRVDAEVLPPLLKIGDRWAARLPKVDDWLAYQLSPAMDEGVLRWRAEALAVYSVRGSAWAWGRNGPHLRATFAGSDQIDIDTAPVHLAGFLPHLSRLLEAAQPSQEAREYAGALVNGLMVRTRNQNMEEYRKYFEYWTQGTRKRGGGDLEWVVGRIARVFPELLPEKFKQMPYFALFYNGGFAGEEGEDLDRYNTGLPAQRKVSLWDLTVGAEVAQPYIRPYLTVPDRPGVRALLRQIHQFLLARGRAALAVHAAASPAGLEEAATSYVRTYALGQLGRSFDEAIDDRRSLSEMENFFTRLFSVYMGESKLVQTQTADTKAQIVKRDSGEISISFETDYRRVEMVVDPSGAAHFSFQFDWGKASAAGPGPSDQLQMGGLYAKRYDAPFVMWRTGRYAVQKLAQWLRASFDPTQELDTQKVDRVVFGESSQTMAAATPLVRVVLDPSVVRPPPGYGYSPKSPVFVKFRSRRPKLGWVHEVSPARWDEGGLHFLVTGFQDEVLIEEVFGFQDENAAVPTTWDLRSGGLRIQHVQQAPVPPGSPPGQSVLPSEDSNLLEGVVAAPLIRGSFTSYRVRLAQRGFPEGSTPEILVGYLYLPDGKSELDYAGDPAWIESFHDLKRSEWENNPGIQLGGPHDIPLDEQMRQLQFGDSRSIIRSYLRGAWIAQKLGFERVDLNFCSPSYGSRRFGGGASLMGNRPLMTAIVQALTNEPGLNVEVSAKVMFFPRKDNAKLPDVAQTAQVAMALEEAGLKRLNVQAQVIDDWAGAFPDAAKELARSLKIPVTYNGRVAALREADLDQRRSGFTGEPTVYSVEGLRRFFAGTGVDKIMVGRALMGDTRLFTGKSPTDLQILDELLVYLPYVRDENAGMGQIGLIYLKLEVLYYLGYLSSPVRDSLIPTIERAGSDRKIIQFLETRRDALASAGLEEEAAKAVAGAEGWVRMRGAGEQGARALVLDAASLEVVPGLVGLAGRLGRSEMFGGRVVLWGAPPQGMEVPGMAQALTPDDLSAWIGQQAREGGAAAVTFVGLEERAPLVQALARARGLEFTPRPPSWAALLAAFVPEPLAEELAAGLEEAELIGGQA